jgi:hypothetical protein
MNGAPSSRDATRPHHRSGEDTRLAKKPNYDFEKRRKELDRKQKKDAKRDERLARKRTGTSDDGEPVDGDAATDDVDSAAVSDGDAA